jgi:hypothetical protein
MTLLKLTMTYPRRSTVAAAALRPREPRRPNAPRRRPRGPSPPQATWDLHTVRNLMMESSSRYALQLGDQTAGAPEPEEDVRALFSLRTSYASFFLPQFSVFRISPPPFRGSPHLPDDLPYLVIGQDVLRMTIVSCTPSCNLLSSRSALTPEASAIKGDFIAHRPTESKATPVRPNRERATRPRARPSHRPFELCPLRPREPVQEWSNARQ